MSEFRLNNPYSNCASDGTFLAISDSCNNRVLIWNQIPTQNNAPADIVLGQANFSSNGDNRGRAVAANTLSYPCHLCTVSGKLIVADLENKRILIWNSLPTANGQAADVVLGQWDFNSNLWSTAQNLTTKIEGVATDGQKLIAVDKDNNRVLIWNSIPTSNAANADVVIGQSSFSANSSGASASQLYGPTTASIHNGRLFICDRGNHRILRFNTIPAVNGASADKVYGQSNFSAASANAGGTTFENGFNEPSSAVMTD